MGILRNSDLAARAGWDSSKGTAAYLGILVSLTLLTFQFIATLRDRFGFRMLPVFERTFDEVRRLLHFCMEWLFYHWIAMAFDYAWYCVSLALSVFFPIVPYLPDISIPSYVKEAGFISIIILRVFESAYLAVPRAERDAARAMTTDEQVENIEISMGKLRPLHHHLHETNRAFYDFSDWLILKLSSLFKSHGLAEGNLVAIGIRKAIREIYGGMMMFGYVRLAGYIIYVPGTWSIDAPTTRTIRKTFTFFVFCAVVALIAAMVFFWGNSFLVTS